MDRLHGDGGMVLYIFFVSKSLLSHRTLMQVRNMYVQNIMYRNQDPSTKI